MMLSQVLHQYRYTQLIAKVRRRSAVLIFFAFAAFFAMSPPINQEICNNGIDDNLDGLIDCQDKACKDSFDLCNSSQEKIEGKK